MFKKEKKKKPRREEKGEEEKNNNETFNKDLRAISQDKTLKIKDVKYCCKYCLTSNVEVIGF